MAADDRRRGRDVDPDHTLITGFPWRSTDLWFLYGAIIVIQTIAIGFGTVFGERLTELSEQRRQAVAQLEAAMDENVGLQRQLVAQAGRRACSTSARGWRARSTTRSPTG